MSDCSIRFSIIMVALNAEPYVANALRSIKTQTFNNYELIFIDGVSKDNTLSIASSSGIDRVKIVSEPDNGIYDAMNKGISHSQGEYLYFLNADDYFSSEKVLEIINEKLDCAGNPEIFYGDIIKVYRDSNKYIKFPASLDRKFFVRKTICHQAIFAKKDLFKLYGGFNIDYPVSADYVWLADMFLNKSIRPKYYNYPICNYYAYGVSNFSSSILENYQAARENFSIFELIRYRYLKWWWKRIKRVFKF